MKDEHIISLLENAPLRSLGENDLTAIRLHSETCSDCRQAFQAAKLSSLMLQERDAVQFEPSPFFHSRVLATLRERRAGDDSWAFGRLWRMAGALASSMVATVAMLAIVTLVIPENQIATSQMSSSTGYSAEEVLLEQTAQTEEVSDAQLLNSIYAEDEEPSR